MTTLDFEQWILLLEDTSPETIYCLYRAIEEESQYGSFKPNRNNGGLFISSVNHSGSLRLITYKAKDAFLKKLNYKFGGDFYSVIGIYETNLLN